MLVTNTFINTYFKPVYANKVVQTSFFAVNTPAFSGKTEDYEKNIFTYQQKLSSLGVKSNLFDKGNYKNLALAKSVYEGFLDIKKAGFDIPKRIYVHCDDAKDHFERGCDAMAYTVIDSKDKKVKPKIYLNTPRYKTVKNFPYAVHSTSDNHKIYNAKMDIYHEFAHCYQAIQNKDFYSSLRKQEFDSETRKEISKSINSYAATDKAEFVAEYFAYKMAGIEIKSDKINLDKLYEKCHGPNFKKKLNLVA